MSNLEVPNNQRDAQSGYKLDVSRSERVGRRGLL